MSRPNVFPVSLCVYSTSPSFEDPFCLWKYQPLVHYCCNLPPCTIKVILKNFILSLGSFIIKTSAITSFFQSTIQIYITLRGKHTCQNLTAFHSHMMTRRSYDICTSLDWNLHCRIVTYTTPPPVGRLVYFRHLVATW